MGAVLAALCLYIATAGTLYYVQDYRDDGYIYVKELGTYLEEIGFTL